MPALLNGGAIGTVQGLQECFGFMLHNLQGKSCLNLELGGDVLLDAGSCAQSLIRLAMWQTPVRVLANARWDDSGIGISCRATLHYADGRTALLTVRWTPPSTAPGHHGHGRSRSNRVSKLHQRRSADWAARAARHDQPHRF